MSALLPEGNPLLRGRVLIVSSKNGRLLMETCAAFPPLRPCFLLSSRTR
uniref:Uncharacterized protein n=1 Tax=Parascaris equorum TaxID=6256 RepID=A0A914RK74_PAREQ